DPFPCRPRRAARVPFRSITALMFAAEVLFPLERQCRSREDLTASLIAKSLRPTLGHRRHECVNGKHNQQRIDWPPVIEFRTGEVVDQREYEDDDCVGDSLRHTTSERFSETQKSKKSQAGAEWNVVRVPFLLPQIPWVEAPISRPQKDRPS